MLGLLKPFNRVCTLIEIEEYISTQKIIRIDCSNLNKSKESQLSFSQNAQFQAVGVDF